MLTEDVAAEGDATAAIAGKRRPRLLIIGLGEDHGPGSDKAASRPQTSEPLFISESTVHLDIDPTEPRRHRMHAAGGACGGD